MRAIGAGVWLEAVRGAEVLPLDALGVEVELVAVGAENNEDNVILFSEVYMLNMSK